MITTMCVCVFLKKSNAKNLCMRTVIKTVHSLTSSGVKIIIKANEKILR
jgi:hypothetical protein